MLKVYTSYNCSSCKKVITWLSDHGIEHEEYNFFSKSLTEKEIKHILHYTENGFEDIISERSNVFKENKTKICDLSVKEFIELIVDYPSILKRPIIVDDVTETLLIGYNKSEMATFL